MKRPFLDPLLIAAQLVADYGKTDPLSADEASEGMCALPELTDAQMEEGDMTAERR